MNNADTIADAIAGDARWRPQAATTPYKQETGQTVDGGKKINERKKNSTKK